MKNKYPFYLQPDEMDCGPTCLQMVCQYYGKLFSLERLRALSETTREGSSLGNLAAGAEKLGLRTLGARLNYTKLLSEVPLPCIAYWEQSHFVVVYKVEPKKVLIADPAHGLIELSRREFISKWIRDSADDKSTDGIALLLEPTPVFKDIDEDKKASSFASGRFLLRYLTPYKAMMIQLIVGLIVGSLLQLIFPFLTQSVVDIGITNGDFHFIYLVLCAQLFLFFGRSSIEVIRNWILLHISVRINISLISDFFVKLMQLPISFFDVKLTGDIMQRINDHQRIENLLTSTTLSVLFSMFNILIFGGILAWYDLKIFTVLLIGSAMYFGWVVAFLKRRKDLDYTRFSQQSDEQSVILELINGMQEIKLHNAERQKRWKWERLQAKLFKISVKSLSLEQIQSVGSSMINEIQGIIITFLSAKLVIDGDLTLGMMLSITYIVGQLNSPIQQIVGFVYSLQDAKIAIERLAEIHSRENEQTEQVPNKFNTKEESAIELKDITFTYPGSVQSVIKNLSLSIPYGKKTAIVGASGSGKTTLLKLLLKFYTPESGDISFGTTSLDSITHSSWRDYCGVVMQEGYIFNDTIANNIALGVDLVDYSRLKNAAEKACIHEFVKTLPLGYETKIGLEGMGISTGQKQRILVARAIYKDPRFVLFDEATSSLDANNEKAIMNNLDSFLRDKTAIIIAHRLSTVQNADQIVVLDQGCISEVGTHYELVRSQGKYFELVKNQLDLAKLNDGNS